MELSLEKATVQSSVPCAPAYERWAICLRLEQSLRNAGWHPLPGPWLDVWALAVSGARVACLSAGRRGCKSSFIVRPLVADLIAATQGIVHPVSPGDIGTFPIISARRKQAADRLHTVQMMLDVIGLRYKARWQRVDLLDFPYRFQVFTAGKDSVISMTACGAFCDEFARWDDGGRNPSREIIRSLRPSMRTMPDAVLWLASSPWVEGDEHQHWLGPLGKPPRELEARTVVAHSPTWVTNPTTTREECASEESDEMAFLREYGAVPMPSGAVQWFGAQEIAAACATMGA